MKIKVILALLFIVALGFTATAQTITLGPRVGVNFARQIVTGDDSQISKNWNDEVKSAAGVQVGLVSNFMIGELFSVQPEVLYTQKGYKLESTDEKVIGKYDYLDVPVLAKIAIGNGPLKGFVTAGPTFSYWMGGENKYKTDGLEFSEDIDFDHEEDGLEKRFEAGASIGLGLAYLIGDGSLNLDLRYNTGFSSVYESDDDARLRNEGFGISVAYLFGL